MKQIIASFVIAAALVAIIPSEASAWYCRARSATGSLGWGSSYYLANANRIALVNCAVRTPRGYTCFITSCR